MFKEKVYRKYECPTCKKTGCWEHCNHCGDKIKWTDYLGNPYHEISKTTGKKVRYAYNSDDSVHRCMLKGTKDKQYHDVKQIDEYIIDEYHTYTRYSGPVFKCSCCGWKDDLPRMLEHHPTDTMCEAALMKKLFKEPTTLILDPNNTKLEDFE